MLNERRLRWSCRRLLRTLGVEPPIDVTELCRRLGVSLAPDAGHLS